MPIIKSKALGKEKGLIKWFLNLIKGRKRLPFKPIVLPTKNEKYKDGAEATLVGYGLLNKAGKTSKAIMSTRIPLLNEKQCNSFLKMPKKSLCVGNQKSGGADCKVS